VEKSVEIPHTLFEYFFFSVVIASLPYKERNVLVGFQRVFFFPLMESSSKFLPVQLILKYTARAHTHTHTHTHTQIQDWFLSPNSFNKFPWATNAESWSWKKRLVAGIHRKNTSRF